MECQTITVDGVAACSGRRRHDRGGRDLTDRLQPERCDSSFSEMRRRRPRRIG